MGKAVIYTVQSSDGMIWGAAFDIMKAQREINRLQKIYDDKIFYITTTAIIDVAVRV